MHSDVTVSTFGKWRTKGDEVQIITAESVLLVAATLLLMSHSVLCRTILHVEHHDTRLITE
jgi:hypothetical protein